MTLHDTTALRIMADTYIRDAPLARGIIFRVCDDIDHDGPFGRAINAHPEAGAPIFGVRALAAIQWFILAGLDGPLVTTWDAARKSGYKAGSQNSSALDTLWEAIVSALERHPLEFAAALDRPVQQSSPQRAAALLTGLTMLNRPIVRILELGASAGMSLRFDRYRWIGPGWYWGDDNSPLSLAGTGDVPPQLTITSRAGCDLLPAPAEDLNNEAIIRSFTPLELEDEQQDLQRSFQIARHTPRIQIDKAPAPQWLEEQLAAPWDGKSTTIVWHSMFWNFLGHTDQTHIQSVLNSAAERMPLARISLEPSNVATTPFLTLEMHS